MFAKTSLPTFGLGKKSPQVVAESVRGSTVARSEILMLYDRWTRTDSGGFIKSIKSAIGVLEEINIVDNFESILGLTQRSMVYNDYIRKMSLEQLNIRLGTYLQEAERAISSLESTITHAQSLIEQWTSLNFDKVVIRYIEGMIGGMTELLGVRKAACVGISKVKSFEKEFEEIQFILLVLSETCEDYIPETAQMAVHEEFALFPRTLEDVRRNNGRTMFSSLVDQIA